MSEAVFQELYDRLNKAQKQAVDAIEGPVMVIAGPGTGKTSILTLRITQILRKTDTAASSILALTFTESGVRAMRKKLVSIIGSRGYEVRIFTFHGFCNEVIRQHPEKFPRIIGGTATDDVGQVKIIEAILQSSKKLDLLRPYGDPLFYTRPILSAIKDLKQEYISPEDFDKLVDTQQKDFDAIPDKAHEKGKHKGKIKGEYTKIQEKIEKNRELQQVYLAYEKTLAKDRLYDYDDMILETIRALEKNEEFLLELQETYQYLLADEHQDANRSQNTLLELLSGFHDNPNLFIVGDEKQAIFRFQGASLDNFLYFKKRFPTAELIQLTDNYRSHQSILDVAYGLINNNAIEDESLRVELRAKGKGFENSSSPITLREYKREDYELRHIAEEIRTRLDRGEKANEIAILYRENRDAATIAHALDLAHVPYRIHSDSDLLADQYVSRLVNLLQAIHDPSKDEFLMKTMLADFNQLHPREVFDALRQAKKQRIPFSEFVSKMSTQNPINIWYAKLIQATKASINIPLVPFLEEIMRDFHFLDFILKRPDSLHALHAVQIFFGQAQKFATGRKSSYLGDFLEHIRVLEEHGLLIKGGSKETYRDEVQLMTSHRSKGLEYDTVYILHLTDGHWGNRRERTYFHLPIGKQAGHSIEDERRLFYVALTRARKEAIISYALSTIAGEEQLPSQFIAEIDRSVVNSEDVSKFETEYEKKPHLELVAKHNSADIGVSILEPEYVQNLFLEQGFSVTALNNYISCPWKYFFSNLIRIPEGQSKHQMYGTAVHDTLRRFFEAYKKDENPSEKEAISWFEEELSKQGMSEIEYDASFAKGKRAISGYLKEYAGSWSRDVFTEYAIAGVTIPVLFGSQERHIPLNGKLDRVEILSPGHMRVIDYKTGSPLSRNEIEGKTKNADGNYKRQLVFYKILIDLHKNGLEVMDQGVLEFIEPDDRGGYHREAFSIESEEVEALKKKIQEIGGEIYSGAFQKKGCEEKDCEFCKIAKTLPKELLR